jgi:Ran GTPase-activating protein (RanGAP) involved in mRNA processing and transport
LALLKQNTLNILELNGNNFTDSGISKLLVILQKKKIQKIDLSGNKFTQSVFPLLLEFV